MSEEKYEVKVRPEKAVVAEMKDRLSSQEHCPCYIQQTDSKRRNTAAS